MFAGAEIWYNKKMTNKTLTRAIREKKPAVIKERRVPRYVVLDWDTYRAWEEKREDMEDHIRFEISERESRGKKRLTLKEVKKKYGLR